MLNGYQYGGQRSLINEEYSPLVECGEYYRNLADKNKGEDDNNHVDRAVTISKPKKRLVFSFPVLVSVSSFSSLKLTVFHLSEKSQYRSFFCFAFHSLAS